VAYVVCLFVGAVGSGRLVALVVSAEDVVCLIAVDRLVAALASRSVALEELMNGSKNLILINF